MWNKQASNNGSDASGVVLYAGTICRCRIMHNLTTGSFSYSDYADAVVARSTGGTAAQIAYSGGMICDCKVTDSKTGSSSGGSIALCGAQSVVSNCVVSGNSAENYGSSCAGVYINAGLLAHCVLAKTGTVIRIPLEADY